MCPHTHTHTRAGARTHTHTRPRTHGRSLRPQYCSPRITIAPPCDAISKCCSFALRLLQPPLFAKICVRSVRWVLTVGWTTDRPSFQFDSAHNLPLLPKFTPVQPPWPIDEHHRSFLVTTPLLHHPTAPPLHHSTAPLPPVHHHQHCFTAQVSFN